MSNSIVDRYVGFSKDASARFRELAIGAIAIIWLFRITSKEQSFQLPADLHLPLILLLVALLFDLLQYLSGAFLWFYYFKFLEYNDKKVKEAQKSTHQSNSAEDDHAKLSENNKQHIESGANQVLQGTENPTVNTEAPAFISQTIHFFFWPKFVFLFIACVLLIIFLSKKIIFF